MGFETDDEGETTRDSEAADHTTPAICPVCGAAFESVSVHDEGVMVNLLDNDQFHRVCFQPVSEDGEALLRFFQHTTAQAGPDEPGTAGGRIP